MSEHLCHIESIQRSERRRRKKAIKNSLLERLIQRISVFLFIIIFFFFSFCVCDGIVIWHATEKLNCNIQHSNNKRAVKEINESLLLGNETTDKGRRSVSVWGRKIQTTNWTNMPMIDLLYQALFFTCLEFVLKVAKYESILTFTWGLYYQFHNIFFRIRLGFE